jgi:Uma2 family endonuclease
MLVNAIGTLEPAVAAPPWAKEEPLYEVINGLKVELLTMGAYANWIALRLARLLGAFVDPKALGTVVMEMLFILDSAKNLRRRPDVAFVSAQKWPPDQPPPEAGDWEVIPDLAVEVVSPNDVFQDVLQKMQEYFRLGVGQVWIVIPSNRQIYVYDSPISPRVPSADQELDGGSLLPGLRMPVGSLFQQQPKVAPAS